MFYLLLVFTLTTAMQKKAFYNPVQVYYQSTSIPASSHAIIINPKAKPRQNIADYSQNLKISPYLIIKFQNGYMKKYFAIINQTTINLMKNN